MLDLIFALKFIHVVAAATMFGVWLCLALVMLLGHRSAILPSLPSPHSSSSISKKQ